MLSSQWISDLNTHVQAFHSLLWLISIYSSTWCTLMIILVAISWMEPGVVTDVVQGYMVSSSTAHQLLH